MLALMLEGAFRGSRLLQRTLARWKYMIDCPAAGYGDYELATLSRKPNMIARIDGYTRSEYMMADISSSVRNDMIVICGVMLGYGNICARLR